MRMNTVSLTLSWMLGVICPQPRERLLDSHTFDPSLLVARSSSGLDCPMQLL